MNTFYKTELSHFESSKETITLINCLQFRFYSLLKKKKKKLNTGYAYEK